ncbi:MULTISPECIES: SMI1/KNR4 family protein [Flavobacterium]|uniref:SMI1/KNR4 family protein n=1 Tax=Flavobacterium TaxID=237 RepID=UPI0011837374|nr:MULTISPECIES: SMI1/KNR4 family protein [Flavobacterium]MCR4031958.1 SMI1/KNR4 family protein [Flavobacterium panacis]
MKNLYRIGELKPLSKIEIDDCEKLGSLPVDYTTFLSIYGTGSINELLMVQKPDEDYIRSNFGDDMDFWNLTEKEEQLLLNSLTIATTIDGDIITAIDDIEDPIVILPRHSDEIVYLANFEKVIDYYDTKYDLKNDLYFDPNHNFEQEYISFVKDGFLNKVLFDSIQSTFLNTISFDKLYNAELQPKYIIQKIGGWVYFDNIGKSAVRVKYQKQFKEEADKIIKLFQF